MEKTQFGMGQVFNNPPKWVVAVVAVLIIISQVAKFVIAGDTAIQAETQVRILLYLSGFDMLILGIASMFGIKPNQNNPT